MNQRLPPDGVGFNYVGYCGQTIPHGYYPYMTFSDGLPSQYNMGTQFCKQCDPSCRECMLDSSENCTACPLNTYLNVLYPQSKTGSCLPKITIDDE